MSYNNLTNTKPRYGKTTVGPFLALLWALASLYTLVSLVKPLPPYRTRLRTLLIGFPAMFVGLAVVGVVLGNSVLEEPKVAAVKSEPASSPEQAEPVIVAKAADPKWQLAGFPNEASFQHATKIKLARYDAYRLLQDQTAINEYCDWLDQSWAISLKADKKFGENPSDDQYAAKSAWLRKKDKELKSEKLAKLGIDDDESRILSEHGSWRVHCAAKEIGWKIASMKHAEAVSSKDISKVRNALHLHYLNRLEKFPSAYFNKDKYSAASCQHEQVKQLHVIGCRLRDYGRETDYDYFVAARLGNGDLAAASIERNTHLTDIGTKKIYTPDGEDVFLARIADRRFDRTSGVFYRTDIDQAFGSD